MGWPETDHCWCRFSAQAISSAAGPPRSRALCPALMILPASSTAFSSLAIKLEIHGAWPHRDPAVTGVPLQFWPRSQPHQGLSSVNRCRVVKATGDHSRKHRHPSSPLRSGGHWRLRANLSSTAVSDPLWMCASWN